MSNRLTWKNKASIFRPQYVLQCVQSYVHLNVRHHQRPIKSNTMKKLIQLVAVCLLPLAGIAAGTSSPPVFQMRLVLDVAAGDCDCDDMVLVHKSGDTVQKEMFHVQHLVLLDQSALKSASVTTNELDG